MHALAKRKKLKFDVFDACQRVQDLLNNKVLFHGKKKIWKRKDVTDKTAEEYLNDKYPPGEWRHVFWNTSKSFDASSPVFNKVFQFVPGDKVMLKKTR